MKTIVKSNANVCLRNAEHNGLSWNDFVTRHHDEYLRIRQQAISDQTGECAYTGLWIGDGTKQKVHIDHFRKRSIYPQLQFDWHNLFAAAKDLDYGSDSKDAKIHGPLTYADHLYKLFYSPLEANLEDMLWYRQDGQIVAHPSTPTDKINFVNNTIELYNLNAPDLIHRRLSIINQLRELNQLDVETIRLCMQNAGFSFLVNFELRQRNQDY